MLVNKHIFLNLHGSEYYSNGIGKYEPSDSIWSFLLLCLYSLV